MSADPDLIRSMTPIQSPLHYTRGRVDGVCVPPHASILACIQFVRYRLDVLAHDVKSFGVCIWLCMCLLQTVSCALSCIRTVQSYDEFPSVQAISDLARPCFRPAVQSGYPIVCVRAHMRNARNAERLPSRGPGESVKHPLFATQLEKICYPVGPQFFSS